MKCIIRRSRTLATRQSNGLPRDDCDLVIVIRHRLPVAVGLVGSVLAGLVLSGCGGGSAGASATSTTKPAASETAFQNCLKSHGVTLPSRPAGSGSFPTGSGSSPTGGSFPAGGFGGGGGGGSGNSTFAQAFQACASLRPAGSGGFGGGSGTQSLALKTYVNCLAIHGVTIPSGSGETSALRALSTDPTAKDKTAETACAALRPKFGGRSSSSTTTTTTTTTA
jgi:hypothetical protein